jgi:signal peptidase II
MQERGAVPTLTGQRRRVAVLLVVVIAAVLLLDQATKTWAENALADRTIHLVWTLRLNLSLNSGVAFGLGHGVTPVLVAAAVLVLVFTVGLSRALSSPLRAVAMGLVLGGALGNLADRVLRSNGGAVIDFIDPQWWPIFNVADTAISCGVILLLISGFGQREEQA